MSTRLTPQQKLRKAIYGSANPTPEQIAEAEARYYEREAAQVTDKELRPCGTFLLMRASTTVCCGQVGLKLY